MATIQLKRAFTYNGSAVEAIDKISRLSGDSALKVGEPMAVRYLESSTASDGSTITRYRYLTVICIEAATVSSPATLTILPSFDNLSDFASYIKTIVPSGGSGSIVVSASDLEYIFSDENLEISGNTQAEFNGYIINILNSLTSRLTWKYL